MAVWENGNSGDRFVRSVAQQVVKLGIGSRDSKWAYQSKERKGKAVFKKRQGRESVNESKKNRYNWLEGASEAGMLQDGKEKKKR